MFYCADFCLNIFMDHNSFCLKKEEKKTQNGVPDPTFWDKTDPDPTNEILRYFCYFFMLFIQIIKRLLWNKSKKNTILLKKTYQFQNMLKKTKEFYTFFLLLLPI